MENNKIIENNETKLADKVIFGNIYTSDSSNEFAEAIAINDGKIIFVGSKKDAEVYTKGAQIIKYENGELITPAFTDSHTHLNQIITGKVNKLFSITKEQSSNKNDTIKAFSDYIKSNESDFYVVYGWELEAFKDEPTATPTASMLAGISDKPILAITCDAHTYWVNDVLLNKLIKENRIPNTDPEGGVIVRDANNNPVGVFKDTAGDIVDNVKPDIPNEVIRQGVLFADTMWLEQGYASRFQAFDNERYNIYKTPFIDVPKTLDREGKLRCYEQASFIINNTEDALDAVDTAIKIRNETKGGNFEMTTVKFFLDGIIENAGAYLFDPYESTIVGRNDYYGTQRWNDDTSSGKDSIKKLGEIIAKANKNGMTCHFHCLGDKALHNALKAIHYAAEGQPFSIGKNIVKESRNCIAHLGLVNPNTHDDIEKGKTDIEIMSDLNVVACLNPWGSKDSVYYGQQLSLLGPDRGNKQYPYKLFLKHGIHISFGTDMGASFIYSSMECFHVLCTREFYDAEKGEVAPNSCLNPSERLTRKEALNAMTIGGAYQLKRENCFGSLTVGKDATLNILSQNILDESKVSNDDILKTKILNTMIKGFFIK